MKKIILLCALIFSLNASATQVDGWDITVKNIKAHEKFFETKDMETYTGDLIVQEIEYTPTEDHVFVTLDLTVSRDNKEGAFFDSSLITLKAGDHTYHRLNEEKDFLSEYQIESFTFLKIKRGLHKGSLLFEIPVAEINAPKTPFYKETQLDVK